MKRMLLMLMALLMATAAWAEEPELPLIPPATEAQLAEAGNAPGSLLVFVNPADPTVWPMLPAEEDGFTCLTSTNWGVDDSVSAVDVIVGAQAGDALAFRYKTSTETGFDLMQVCVNGEVVKVFTGESGWAQYAIAFPEAGEYEVSFRYSKDTVSAGGSDAVYIRDVQLLSGDAAAAALAANPVYPVGAERTLTVLNADAREIVFDDPTFALTTLNGLARYYIVPGGEVRLRVTLAAEDDPDGAVIRAGEVSPVVPGAVADGYELAFPLTTWTAFVLTPAADSDLMEVRTVVCFPDEQAAQAYVGMLQGNGYQVSMWGYTGRTACAITVIDQHGEFVEGVEVSVQTWDGIATMASDAEGTVAFSVQPGEAAVVRIVGAPEGYAFDPERIWLLDEGNAAEIVDLTRVEE